MKYFHGDNENAIKVQIYCTLIANLLMTVVQKTLKRSWAFSNLVSFCKIHLFNYIHLLNFLENPDKDWQKTLRNEEQLSLFWGAYFCKTKKLIILFLIIKWLWDQTIILYFYRTIVNWYFKFWNKCNKIHPIFISTAC